MISGKKVLAIIPARSGSKGLPNKNIKKLVNKPLIAWTLEEANKSKYIDKILVSSDSQKILDISKKYSNIISHLRNKKLSRDNSIIVDVIISIIKEYNDFDYIVLLQPTSPFKKYRDIDLCLKKIVKYNYQSVASVANVKKNIEWFFEIDKIDSALQPVFNKFPKNTNRQFGKKFYQFSGDFYIVEKKWLIKNKRLVSNKTKPYILKNNLIIDIDDEIDFKIANFLAKKA
jgi:N-acylneuraminate cytidylyltransferase